MIVALTAVVAGRRRRRGGGASQAAQPTPSNQRQASPERRQLAGSPISRVGFPGRRHPPGELIALVIPAAGVIAGTLVVLAHRVAYSHIGVMSTEVTINQAEAVARALTLLLPLAGALTVGIAAQAVVDHTLFSWLNKRPLDGFHGAFATMWSLLLILAVSAGPRVLQLPGFLVLAAVPIGALVVARTESAGTTSWKEALVASARWGSVVSAGLAVVAATAMWVWGGPTVGRHMARTGAAGTGWGGFFDIETNEVNLRLVEPDPDLETAGTGGAALVAVNAGVVLVLVPTCVPGGEGRIERIPTDRLREIAPREDAICADES